VHRADQSGFTGDFMPNVIGGQRGTRYFQVPDSFVRSGDLRDLSGSAVKYYVFLCQPMNQTGQVELEYTNQEICIHTDIKDHSTAKKAREELRAHERIRFRKGPSGGFIHVMLDDSDEVFAAVKGRKPVRYHLRREKLSSEVAREPQASRKTPRSLTPPAAPPGRTTARCKVHRSETEHWERAGQLLCEECHPNPRRSKDSTTRPSADCTRPRIRVRRQHEEKAAGVHQAHYELCRRAAAPKSAGRHAKETCASDQGSAWIKTAEASCSRQMVCGSKSSPILQTQKSLVAFVSV